MMRMITERTVSAANVTDIPDIIASAESALEELEETNCMSPMDNDIPRAPPKVLRELIRDVASTLFSGGTALIPHADMGII